MKLVTVGFLLVPDDRRDGGVVTVVDPGEEVVLDLIVESAVQVAKQGAAHVGGCGNLRGVIFWVTAFDCFGYVLIFIVR